MSKQIKHNPYSTTLARALKAVSELSHPDYVLVPLSATAEMCEAGCSCCPALTPQEAGQVYATMVAAWNAVSSRTWDPDSCNGP